MRLTKDKKDKIRAAIVARTFPDKVFSDAAAPLVDALRTNAVVDGAAKALEDFPQYVSSCATLTVSLGHGQSCLVRLPFGYARYGGFSRSTGAAGAHRCHRFHPSTGRTSTIR